MITHSMSVIWFISVPKNFFIGIDRRIISDPKIAELIIAVSVDVQNPVLIMFGSVFAAKNRVVAVVNDNKNSGINNSTIA